MKLKEFLSMAALATMTCISCTNMNEALQQEDCKDEHVPLKITVGMQLLNSRSVITGTGLLDGEVIGLSLYDNDGNDYDGLPYSNIRFTADGEGSTQSWTPETDVMLSASKAVMYAYYPYDSSATDITSIPVYASSEIQTDYLYATPVQGLYNHSPEAQIVMNHALSAVRISFRRGTYTGSGEVTDISLKGDGLATSAKLDAGTGELKSIEGYGNEIAPEMEPLTLSAEWQDRDIIVIPAISGKPMEIKTVIDGEIFQVTIPEARIAQGRISVYEAVVNDAAIDLSSVRIDEWGYDSAGNPTFRHDWTIRLIGDKEGISFANSIGGDGSISIMAVPMLNDAEVMSPAVTGKADYSETVDNHTGIRTITLFNIQSDIEISYDGYNLWVTTSYGISDISTASTILSRYVQAESYCQKMLIDGKEVEPTETFLFDTIGEHTVRTMFTRNGSDYNIAENGKYRIPESMFRQNPDLTEVHIPEGITHIHALAFSSCNALKKVSLPKSLKALGYHLWKDCSSLTRISFPDGVKLNYGILSNCISLTDVRLPADLKRIPSSIVAGCTSLKEIKIPDNVTFIENGAFSRSGISDLFLPDGIQTISDNLCASCPALRSIRFPAGLSSIGANAFSRCNELETIIHSDGTAYTGCINLPEGITTVKALAFYASEKFSSLHIPSTLTSTDFGAFAVNNISSVSINPENPVFDVRGNALIETASNTLMHGFSSSAVEESVTAIGRYAFYQINRDIIDLHEGITEIGENALTACKVARIISRASIPPALNTNSLNVMEYNGVLKVPAASLEAYRETWFRNETGYLGAKILRWSLEALEDGE